MADKYNCANWKQNLVLIAKNSFVWLYQLSKKYNQTIASLDQIPIQELEELRDLGISGIWLIGIWNRSPASKKIKSLYGFNHSAASAYSIFSYEISGVLGGRDAYLKFRDLARSLGIRIGCDMVPNHTGIDSPWVMDHPDWFIEADGNPSPDFIFTSPDISSNNKVEIRIEDGYYTRSGAAEVFSYKDTISSLERFFYHGNDGTSMPWNDTAQLNYLNPQARNAVRNIILEVAADFDIIRLDAAMTLTRQHFKRLWFPGDDGQRCIPTREKYRMTQSEFDRQMPDEFWELVVKDIHQKHPDTLLIAEAFWLMEGYFIRQIGMERVYNSAFMNMLKDEENRKFKNCLMDMAAIKENALDHLVNYQTTPDEESAINQFGSSEKYFGVATLLCTLPGLPMFGHGQFHGYRERYGMDYIVPHMQEIPEDKLLEKHRITISPLLKSRELFSTSQHFKLCKLLDSNGHELDDVITFTNSCDGRKVLVAYNNSSQQQKGMLEFKHLTDISVDSMLVELRGKDLDFGCRVEYAPEGINFSLSPYGAGAFLIS